MPPVPPPDAAQAAILDAYAGGKLSVIAVPGAGKTTLLVNLTCRLIERGCPPQRILLVTFTEKAAGELQARLDDTVRARQLLGLCDDQPRVRTLHALGARILEDGVNALTVQRAFSARLWDEAERLAHVIDVCWRDRDRYAKLALPAKAPSDEPDAWLRLGRHLTGAIDHARERGLAPADIQRLAERSYPPDGPPLLRALADLAEAYEVRKQAHGAIDFADQQLLALRLLEDPAVAARWQSAFDYLIEDEGQDSSLAQHQLVNRLAAWCGNLIRVGDPMQSIYAWRDAFLDGIHAHHRQADHCHELATNYRSGQAIIALANAWLAHWRPHHPVIIRPRPDAPAGTVVCRRFRRQEDEAAWIIDQIHRLRLAAPDTSIAVLARGQQQLNGVQDRLDRAHILCHRPDTGGFYQSPLVRSAFHLLSLIEALGRRPFAGAGAERAVYHLQALAAIRGGGARAADWQPLLASPSGHAFLCDPGLARVSDWGSARDDMAALKDLVTTGVRVLLFNTGPLAPRILASLVALGLPSTRADHAALTKLVAAGQTRDAGNSEPTLAAWLVWLQSQIAYSSEASPPRVDPAVPGTVVLSTIHAAKGLEWDAVFVPGLRGPEAPRQSLGTNLRVQLAVGSGACEDDAAWRQQHMIARDESCRLAYVAMTRARHHLYLSTTHGSAFWDMIERHVGAGQALQRS